MIWYSQLLLASLFISDTLESLYESDCTIPPGVSPDLSESCHDLNINKVHDQLQVLTAEMLSQQPSPIETLNITGGGLTGIEQDCFSNHRKSLKSISIVCNNIETFPGLTFSELSLKNLDLRNNSIVNLKMHIFDDSKIEDLNLNYNKISNLLKHAFASEFTSIHIAKNRVSFIDTECFPNSLELLDLRYNSLHEIRRKHFSNLENLRQLYLANNVLLTVDFTNNDLNKLEVVDLSFNRIADINQASFDTLAKLEFLNLASNNIKRISSATLQIFGKLKILDVSFNRFSNFPYEHLPNSVETVSTFGNPWNCQCIFRMERYFAHNKITSFRCESNSRIALPFCVSYGNTCAEVANDSLITMFTEHMSTDLIRYCSCA